MQAKRPSPAVRVTIPALLAVVLLVLPAGELGGCGPSGDRAASRGAAERPQPVSAVRRPLRPPPVVRNATIRGRVRVVPSAAAVRRAWRFARRSPGIVSVAVLDSRGRLRSLRGRRLFISASVAKAFMLAALLRELEAAGEPLDEDTAATLRAMITLSDNHAADAIYYRLGDGPIEEAARAAGAATLDVRGWWSVTYLSAADGARFVRRVAAVTPRRFRGFAMSLLAGITPPQRWGIPDAAGSRWRVWFKGGWRTTARGALTHQIALLRRGRTRLAIAVLTDALPSMSAGIETIEGIARRLLPRRVSRPGRPRPPPARPRS